MSFSELVMKVLLENPTLTVMEAEREAAAMLARIREIQATLPTTARRFTTGLTRLARSRANKEATAAA